MAIVLENAALDLMCDPLKDYLDDGVLEIYDGAVLLVTFTLPDKAVATSVDGVIDFGALGPENAIADGEAADICKFWTNAKGALVATGDVGMGDPGDYAVVLDNTNIKTGQAVSLTSATLTLPSGV
jgi:hypothetical protein